LGYKMLKELDFRELKKEFSLDFKGLIQVGSFVSKEFSILKELGMTDFIFIDANPNIMEQLLNNVDENCKVLNELISDEDYKLYTFNIANHTQSSSMLKFDKHKKYYPTMSDVVDTIELTSVTLDTLIKRENINMNNFNTLMMDVQGAEIFVLKGFNENISNIDYIYTELNFDSMYEGCMLEPEFTQYLNGLGFNLVKYFDTGFGWGDGLYIRGGK